VGTQQTVEVEFLSPETAIVALTGEHDLDIRERVRAALATARAARNIVVDFSACTFADTFVITTVLRAWRDQQDAHGELAIAVPPEADGIRRGLELMGVDGFLQLHENRAAAIASLPPRRRLRLTAISEHSSPMRHQSAA
jgi:anti-anti-sigma regulatory factor